MKSKQIIVGKSLIQQVYAQTHTKATELDQIADDEQQANTMNSTCPHCEQYIHNCICD